MKHAINRVRHDAPRRTLVVQGTERVTPGMLRVALGGPELAGFSSPAADDHVKLFVDGPDGIVGRHYTPRRFDAAANELLIDFALHGAAQGDDSPMGPVTQWASEARPGSSLVLGGPRGSTMVPTDFDWWLLVGDETALPAIARRVEGLPAGTPVTSIVAVTGPAEEQAIATAAAHAAVWVHRPTTAAADPAPLLAAVQAFQPPPGDGFVFIAGEAGVVRRLRSHMLDTAGHDPAWLKAAGYWRSGQADVHEALS